LAQIILGEGQTKGNTLLEGEIIAKEKKYTEKI
jgi:hypothetical protein